MPKIYAVFRRWRIGYVGLFGVESKRHNSICVGQNVWHIFLPKLATSATWRPVSMGRHCRQVARPNVLFEPTSNMQYSTSKILQADQAKWFRLIGKKRLKRTSKISIKITHLQRKLSLNEKAKVIVFTLLTVCVGRTSSGF